MAKEQFNIAKYIENLEHKSANELDFRIASIVFEADGEMACVGRSLDFERRLRRGRQACWHTLFASLNDNACVLRAIRHASRSGRVWRTPPFFIRTYRQTRLRRSEIH